MTKWIKIKEEELKLLLEFCDSRLKDKFSTTNIDNIEKFMTAIHYLRINQAKLTRKKCDVCGAEEGFTKCLCIHVTPPKAKEGKT